MSSWSQGLSIVGTAVGTYYGGPVGGAVGGMIGGYVGATFDPTAQFYGPRLSDLSVMTSTYGNPIPLLFGPGVRVAGNVIWSSGILENVTVKKTDAGGKGGGGGSAMNTYSYRVSYAVAFSEGPIKNLKRVWMNKRLVWDTDEMAGLVAGLFAEAAQQQVIADYFYARYAGLDYYTDGYRGLEEGELVEGDGQVHEYFEGAYLGAQESADLMLATAEADQALADAVAVDDTGWAIGGGSGLLKGAMGGLALYIGDGAQLPDPTLSGYLGAETPAYRHTAYVVFTDVELADFGNAMPQVEVEVNGLRYSTPSAICEYVCEASGMDQGDFSFGGGLEQESIAGYAVATASNAMSAILPLTTVYHFDICEQAGSVRFTRRANGTSATVPREEMGSSDRRDGGGGEPPITITRKPDCELLDSVSVTYKDADRQRQENTQIALRTNGRSQNVRAESVAMAITADKAHNVASRLLWESWLSRTGAKLRLSDRWRWVQTGTVLVVPVADSLQPMRVIDSTRGKNGTVDIQGTIEDPALYGAPAAGETAIIPDPTMPEVGDTFLYVFNSPVLGDESLTSFTWVGDGASRNWRSGAVYRSIDYGVNYSLVAPFNVRNTTGTVGAILPAARCDIWDRVNTLDVTLLYEGHTLVSVTEEQVLNGLNAFWLGDQNGSHGEIIQAATVELLTSSPKVYRLSNLLRGRRGTEHEVGLHADTDVVVFFEAGLVNSLDYGLADVGLERTYKGVATYQNILDVADISIFTNTCERARPRAPVQAAASRDGSNNVELTWIRRTRKTPPAMGYGEAPLDEVSEAYEVDVYSGLSVVRTISTSTPTATYTSAQQTSDGLTPGNAVHVKIYQISGLIGRGHAGDFTL